MDTPLKRILYVGGFELPDKNAAAQRVLGNAKALRALGYEVVFLDVSKEIKGDTLSAPHETGGFLTYSQRHSTSIGGLLSYCLSPLHVEEVLEKHNGWYAVIAYNYPALALSQLRRLCRRRGIRLYGDCTEWHTLVQWSLKFLLIQADMFLRMIFVQKRLDGVIVISRLLERHFSRYTKCVILPPLVDAEDGKWKSEGAHRLSGDRLELVYFGSPGLDKDLLNVVLAVLSKSSQAVRLRIVGISQEQYEAIYPCDQKRVKSLLEAGKLSFLGRLPHRDALAVVKQADYTIFYRERTRTAMAGFPTKFVESISCGVPVITTETSDLREYSPENKNAILLPCESFAERFEELLDRITTQKFSAPIVEATTFDFRHFIPRLRAFLEN